MPPPAWRRSGDAVRGQARLHPRNDGERRATLLLPCAREDDGDDAGEVDDGDLAGWAKETTTATAWGAARVRVWVVAA